MKVARLIEDREDPAGHAVSSSLPSRSTPGRRSSRRSVSSDHLPSPIGLFAGLAEWQEAEEPATASVNHRASASGSSLPFEIGHVSWDEKLGRQVHRYLILVVFMRRQRR